MTEYIPSPRATEMEHLIRIASKEQIEQTIGAMGGMSESSIEDTIRRVATDAVNAQAPELGSEFIDLIVRILSDEYLRYGALQPLIEDPTISEIMVNGGGRDPKTGDFLTPKIFYEKDGVVRLWTGRGFSTEQELENVVSRIGQMTGRRCDEATPTMDAQMPDGSRVNAVHHSIAIDGQSLNIRKFKKDVMDVNTLIELGSATPAMMAFLISCVRARQSILIAGGTGSGKTTMLNILSQAIPPSERVVVVEDTTELQLHQPNLVRLQARAANSEGEGAVTIHDLIVNCLRMRPDRIVVGECRSDETIEMLQAMQTGHDGSLTTVHANTAREGLTRVKTMVKSSAADLPTDMIDQQIVAALDLVVHVTRLPSGRRVVDEIITVDRFADGVISTTQLFGCKSDSNGVKFYACGLQPLKIKQKILDAGASYNPHWFFKEGEY